MKLPMLFVAILSLMAENQSYRALLITESEEALRHYSGTRRYEGRNGNRFGWLEAAVEFSEQGRFSYRILGHGGSEAVVNRALKPLLEEEAKSDPALSALTAANYAVGKTIKSQDELVWLELLPLRKEKVLIDGSAVIDRQTFDLIRIEGVPAKDPVRFLTSEERVVKHYERLNGVRVPARAELYAKIRFFGRSNATVLYRYHQINGQPVSPP